MTSSSFYEEGSRVLTPGAFEFVLDSELKRAVRSQNFLTLVVVETSREWEGMMVTADDGTVQEVAQIIGKEVRDTDLIGHTDKGLLALVLLDADFDHSTRVIDRVVSRIENYSFPSRSALLSARPAIPPMRWMLLRSNGRRCRGRSSTGAAACGRPPTRIEEHVYEAFHVRTRRSPRP